jgi:hypothetical protein
LRVPRGRSGHGARGWWLPREVDGRGCRFRAGGCRDSSSRAVRRRFPFFSCRIGSIGSRGPCACLLAVPGSPDPMEPQGALSIRGVLARGYHGPGAQASDEAGSKRARTKSPGRWVAGEIPTGRDVDGTVGTDALFAWHQPAVFFSQNKPATNNQPVVLFSQNKPAPAISHWPTE